MRSKSVAIARSSACEPHSSVSLCSNRCRKRSAAVALDAVASGAFLEVGHLVGEVDVEVDEWVAQADRGSQYFCSQVAILQVGSCN